MRSWVPTCVSNEELEQKKERSSFTPAEYVVVGVYAITVEDFIRKLAAYG